jgi:hypothetical protein
MPVDLVVNLKTAEERSATLFRAFLVRADKVIEQRGVFAAQLVRFRLPWAPA